jgi:hypothetical protein
MLMRVVGVSDAKLPCNDPVARQTKSFRFIAGERDGESFFRARAIMTNSEVVGQLKTVIEGGRALALLHAGDDALGKRLASAIKVATDRETLTLSWSARATDVWEMMEQQAKRMAAYRAKHAASRKHHDGDQKKPSSSQPKPGSDEDF